MNEMSINWKRLGVVSFGLFSLILLTILIFRYSDLMLAIRNQPIRPLMTQLQDKSDSSHPQSLQYKHAELQFSLELPLTWEGYKVFLLSASDYGEDVVSISLPVERYRDDLLQPRDLKRGVMLVGVRAVSRDYVKREQEKCKEQQALLDRYLTSQAKEESWTGSGKEQALIDHCLSLGDPKTGKRVDQTYLGSSAKHFFYRIPLEHFDNGFKVVPKDLESEIESVYKSFKSW